MNRRTAIRWMVAASAVAGAGRRVAASTDADRVMAYKPAMGGYGTDPDLQHPLVPWQRTMTPHQLQLITVLADSILPGTADAPAPSVIGVPEFVDEWISAPYPEQIRDRAIILAGLAWLEEESRHRSQLGFLDLDADTRLRILAVMAGARGSAALAAQSVFFRRLRFLVVGGYYTTPEGFRDIGYVGNVALSSYPPPTQLEVNLLDAKLRELGLENGWRSLLKQNAASDWRGWASPRLPRGWHIQGGVLSKRGEVEDLITNEIFANFELQLEWKIAKGGNSGIFYRATHQYDHIYWSAPEYQLLDDANEEDGRSRLTAAGAAYGVYPASAGIVLPFDHWNTTRLLVNGPHVEHWLNGHKVVEYELWSTDWKARVAASKFAPFRSYGLAKSGFIGIQGDHDGRLELRRIRIRELPETSIRPDQVESRS